jgi:nucleotide-binding universal stress UspA family protein
MYKNVLVALDGSRNSENVLPYAIPLVRTTAASATLVHVLPGESRASDAGALSYLGTIATAFRQKGIDVEQRVLHGDPALEILGVVAALRADLLTLTTHGRGGGTRWIFGSVAHKVLGACPCPLLVVRGLEAPHPEIRRVVVPLDGSAASAAALPHARVFARAFKARLQFLFVASEYGIEAKDSKLRRWMEHEKREMEARFKALSAEIRDLESDSLTLEGDPATRILELSEAREPAIIVMGSHGRTGLKRWAFGSVADKVLQAAKTPVLVASQAR